MRWEGRKSWSWHSEKAFIWTPKGTLEKTDSLDLMFPGCDAWNNCMILWLKQDRWTEEPGLVMTRLSHWIHSPQSYPTSRLVCLLAQLCPTICDPMDCSLPGSSVHGILQAGILEWVAIPSSRGSSQPRDRTHVSCVSCTAGRFSTTSATWEAPNVSSLVSKM